MQVQKIQNNNFNPHFQARPNFDIKLRMSDITDHLQKKLPDSDLKSADLGSMFEKANQNKKNDEGIAILTGNEIYEFFEMSWRKLRDTSLEIYDEMQNFVRIKRDEMWKSVERDLTPAEQEQMKNLIKMQKQASKDMAKSANKMTRLRQDDSGKVTAEQIKKAEEEYAKAAEQYHTSVDEIDKLKYDKSKLDTTKYVDLDV